MEPEVATRSRLQGRGLQLAGLALFLFIPLVLFLFVAHPEPVGASLVAGATLMVGHRFLARPYLARAAERKCLWCNRTLSPATADETRLQVGSGASTLALRTCPTHLAHARRFFDWTARLRLSLRLGIFVPLLALLGALAATSIGSPSVPLAAVTAAFQLLVGITVNLAALGPRLGRDRDGAAAAFPVHNFSLLGLRALLWIFRLVGLWWIARGAFVLLRGGGLA